MKSIKGITLLFFFWMLFCCSKEKISPLASNPPVANFNYTANVSCFDGSVEVWFNNTSTEASTFLWNFGDGSTSSGQSPKKIYLQSGTYQVSLTAFAHEQKAVTVEEIIVKTKVINSRPVADFDVTNSNPNRLEFIVTNKSSGATSYRLDFGDGSMPAQLESFDKITHAYSGPGIYLITLFTFGVDGCNLATKEIKI